MLISSHSCSSACNASACCSCPCFHFKYLCNLPSARSLPHLAASIATRLLIPFFRILPCAASAAAVAISLLVALLATPSLPLLAACFAAHHPSIFCVIRVIATSAAIVATSFHDRLLSSRCLASCAVCSPIRRISFLLRHSCHSYVSLSSRSASDCKPFATCPICSCIDSICFAKIVKFVCDCPSVVPSRLQTLRRSLCTERRAARLLRAAGVK